MQGFTAGSVRVKRFLVTVSILFAFVCAPFVSANTTSAEESGTSIDGASDPTQFGPDREALTRKYLKEIRNRLDSRIRQANSKHLWQDGKWRTALRNQLIEISMWGVFQDATAWILGEVGDKTWVRKTLFFAMPFFEWMTEPFVLAVNTDAPPGKPGAETERIARFIAAGSKAGMTVSMDNVGDAALSEEDAQRYLDFYVQLMKQLADRPEIREINFSIKLSALVYQLNKIANVRELGHDLPEQAKEKIDEIRDRLITLLTAADAVKGKKTFIRLDMEEYAYRDGTLALFREIVDQNPSLVRNENGSLRLGVVIQAYLRDSWKQLDELKYWGAARQVRIPVRLVKGAYEKYEKQLARQNGAASPVWNAKQSTDASFEGLSEFLLLNMDSFQPAFATHNIRSIAHVMALGQFYGIGKDGLEFQMLYGMGDEIKEVVAELGCPLRIYVPTGTCARGLKYAGRRFAELASRDSALSKSLRGEYIHLEGPAPGFIDPQDRKDGENVDSLVSEARDAWYVGVE